MSNIEVSRKPGRGLTLADMIAQIAPDQSLPARKRQDASSALRVIAKALKSTTHDVSAHAGRIRDGLKDFAPAMIGLKPERWANVQSLARFAFAHLKINGARSREPLSRVWAEGLALMPTKALRVGLLSFGRYCTPRGLEPEDVTQATADAFKEHLLETRISRNPRETHRMACKLWNEAAENVPSWPKHKVGVPSYRNSYIVPWDTFRASLKQAVDGYLDYLGGKDRFAERDFKPLRPSSIATKAAHLHEFCSALVWAGHDPASLESLKDLVAEEAIKKGLSWFLDVRNAKRQAHAVAVTLLIMAKHKVRLRKSALERLRKLCKALDTTRRGMTEKNKVRMRQFDDAAVLDALLQSPRKLRAEAAKAGSPCKRALKLQTALAIELLLMVPIRLENLSHLEIGKHIVRMRKGVRIIIPEHETKNGQAYDAVFLPDPSRLIEEYIDRYLPVVQRGKQSAWLFPGYKQSKMHPPFRKQIMTAIKRLAGATLHPHGFRHLAAKLILDAEPGAYGKVRLVLGHTSTQTTQRAYAGSENAAALRHYDETILNRRGPAHPVSLKTGTRGK